ncbi:MAG: hypothetical protein D6B27_11875 [Gammaproteobacteria bacterium]|nr:MAG: hypothetical protein D6B27_11875 [Gammaproteobacteria bacterium]
MIKKYLLSIFILLYTTANAGDNTLIIAAAEEPAPQEIVGTPIIRILFQKQENSWIPLNNQESQSKLKLKKTDWTIAFDGKNLGTIRSIDDLKSPDCTLCFPRYKVFRVANPKSFPKLGNKEQRFSNWAYTPKNRPIVLINSPNYMDHEHWKRFYPHKKLIETLFPKIKEIIKSPYHCNGAPNWNATPINLTENDIDLFRSYKNKNGALIISAGLSGKHTQNCDGPTSPTDKPIWFYIDNGIKLIGMELDLLDAGDYDNDGETEFVFINSGYNSDGYTLFESKFSQRTDYYWKYH